MKARNFACSILLAALLPALLLRGLVQKKSATARNGAAFLPPCGGRTRRRMSHTRRKVQKEQRKRKSREFGGCAYLRAI
jgi:hypothetical protein